jgi:hypothetical protein
MARRMIYPFTYLHLLKGEITLPLFKLSRSGTRWRPKKIVESHLLKWSYESAKPRLNFGEGAPLVSAKTTQVMKNESAQFS